MSSNIVRLGPEYFPQSAIGRPIANADIYVGIPDTDPEVVANQKQVSIQQEDGTLVAIAQPVNTGAGGVPLYDGSPVTILVSGDYSLKVLNSLGSQIYYVPSIVDQALSPGNFYYPDYTETDQGVVGDNSSVKALVDLIGTTNKATLYFTHNSGSEFTDYSFSITETIPANITCIFEKGARLDPDSAILVTILGDIIAGNTQIFAGPTSLTVTSGAIVAPFAIGSGGTVIKEIYPEWFGALGDGSTDDTVAIAHMYASLSAGNSIVDVIYSGLDYVISEPIFLGIFRTSENSQSSFTWAGRTRFWGGTQGDSFPGLRNIGRSDRISGTTRILYIAAASAPMFVSIGNSNIVWDGIFFDGDGGGGAEASEAIFTAGQNSSVPIFNNCSIKNCVRGLRFGSNVDQTEDPITFTDYENPTGVPTTNGGWSIDQINIQSCNIASCSIPISSETAQAILFDIKDSFLSSSDATGYGFYLQSGKPVFNSTGFAGDGIADIFLPATHGTARLSLKDTHSESSNGIVILREKLTDTTPFPITIINHNGGSLQLKGGVALSAINCSLIDIDMNQNNSTGAGGYASVDLLLCSISGDVGGNHDATSAGRLHFFADRCTFDKASVTDPWNAQFSSQRMTRLSYCRFIGDTFDAATLRLNYIGDFIIAPDATGNTNRVQGASTADFHSIIGTAAEVYFFKDVYREEGAFKASATAGARVVLANELLEFRNFSGETIGNAIGTWNNRFNVRPNGSYWTIRLNGLNSQAWGAAATPADGTWVQGDVWWNTGATAGGSPGAVCTTGGTPGTWKAMANIAA